MAQYVLSYDDDPILREQIRSIFFSIRDEYILLEVFPDAQDVLDHLRTYKPDIVLMDLQMTEDEDGLKALYVIKKKDINIKVLILTMFEEDEKIIQAICLGADGYMLKSDFVSGKIAHETLRKSLHIIFEEGAYLTPSVAKRVLKLFSDVSIADRIKAINYRFQAMLGRQVQEAEGVNTTLTRMQITVLRKVVDGKSTIEIARELFLSENTINTHIKAIYEKLGVHSRARVIRKAMELNWVD